MVRFGTTIFATFCKGPLVANEGSDREGSRRSSPPSNDRDHESTNTFNRIENPPDLCIRGGPSEHDGCVNMSSAKKRAHSPEVDGPPSKRQSWSNRIYQKVPLKRRWRGPKDDHIKALEKLERRRNRLCGVFQDTAYIPNTTHAPQLNTHVHRTDPASGKSPLQRCPKPAVP